MITDSKSQYIIQLLSEQGRSSHGLQGLNMVFSIVSFSIANSKVNKNPRVFHYFNVRLHALSDGWAFGQFTRSNLHLYNKSIVDVACKVKLNIHCLLIKVRNNYATLVGLWEFKIIFETWSSDTLCLIFFS